MEQTPMTTKKAVTVVAFLVLLLISTFIIPSRWVGVSTAPKRTPLLLKDPSEFAFLSKDNNSNDSPDWKDLLLEETSSSAIMAAQEEKVTEEARARLQDPNNLTASFSKNVYTASAYIKKNGTLSKEDQGELILGLLEGESKKIVVKKYIVSDLKIKTSDDSASKKEYGNALGKILKKADEYKMGLNDTLIIQAYNVEKDASVLEILKIKKNNAKTILNELLAIQVPYSAVPYHLLMVNTLSEYTTVVEGLSMADTDPVRATIAFNDYYTINASLLNSLNSVRLYFQIQNIIFSNNEPGYEISSMYTNTN